MLWNDFVLFDLCCWVMFLVLFVGVFLLLLDFFIVNVVLLLICVELGVLLLVE